MLPIKLECALINLYLQKGVQDPVKLFALTFLSFAAILQFLDSAQIIIMGALRGMNDTFIPMLFGIVAYWLVGLSSGYYFGFVLQWQGNGLWMGLCSGIGFSTSLLLARLYQKNKMMKN